ncbi:hypothetical protein [Cyanobium sp. Morenito 9A2]|uniref:hypothetical protein n=1 Tax=Cyanobium sp. Morenito 9A2 TaxID=2823718 RepID=UPI0020CEE776|nr:hypothetical protein [Cyanobium sp. Morenito 9A2]MCP9849813.1 hypothetical protein [Cyanobium sp. Morenito 9A2]
MAVDSSEQGPRFVNAWAQHPPLRFFGGVALGVFLLAIPWSLEEPLRFGSVEAIASAGLVLLCGSLTARWGANFVAALSRALDSLAL